LDDLEMNWTGRTFAGFPTFWPMTFHLFASYSLIAASRAALFLLVSHGDAERWIDAHFVLGKLCVVHVLCG
jgi:hypothetical protein